MATIEFLRQFRFAGYAIFDITISFLCIYLLSGLLSKLFLKIRVSIPKQNWLFLTLPIGILAHLLVGKITLMTQNFIDIHSNYILKILILGLLFFGLYGIKIIKQNKSI